MESSEIWSHLPVLGPVLIFSIFIIFGLFLIPYIFYLITLQNAFNDVSPKNRKMEGGLVWLSLIPLFGTIWQFFVVMKLSDSLAAEFIERGNYFGDPNPGRSIGLAHCILSCCSVIPFLGFLAAIGGFVCWIIYWVQISGFRRQLKEQWFD